MVTEFIPNALSWAQAAKEAARRGTMLLLEAKLSLKSRRHVTKSMEGQDKMQRSESKSLGPAKKRKTRAWALRSCFKIHSDVRLCVQRGRVCSPLINFWRHPMYLNLYPVGAPRERTGTPFTLRVTKWHSSRPFGVKQQLSLLPPTPIFSHHGCIQKYVSSMLLHSDGMEIQNGA